MRQNQFCQIFLFVLGVLFVSTSSADGKIRSPENIPGTIKVNAEKVIELAESASDLMIIDSRIREDRLQGYIEGSVSLPDEETNCESLSKLMSGKHQTSLYYCNGPKCGRSVKAVNIALGCGYDNIYWFRGGFEEWKEKNYPYIKE